MEPLGARRSAGSGMLLCHSQNLEILCDAGNAVGQGMMQPFPSGPGYFCGSAAGPGWGWRPGALSPHWPGELYSGEKAALPPAFPAHVAESLQPRPDPCTVTTNLETSKTQNLILATEKTCLPFSSSLNLPGN